MWCSVGFDFFVDFNEFNIEDLYVSEVVLFAVWLKTVCLWDCNGEVPQSINHSEIAIFLSSFQSTISKKC